MLTEEQRKIKIQTTGTHFFQSVKERRHLFPIDYRFKDCVFECIGAFRDPMKSVILEDKRMGVNSTHVCVFVGQTGYVIGVPLQFTNDLITFLTIKDLHKDFNDPNWFVRAYNGIAKVRGMETLPLVFKP